MYLDNKYTRLYYNIIDHAKSRKSPLGYYEKHHIVPRSLGGTNDPGNLVRLTGREHFICHRLLVKMTEGAAKSKMTFALNSMMNRRNNDMKRYVPNSRIYDYLRLELSNAHKRLGRSDSHKAAISKAHTGKYVSDITRKRMSDGVKAAGPAGGAIKGSIRKPSTRAAISEARKGIKFTEEHRKKLSEAAKLRAKNGNYKKGKTFSEEHRRKLSEAAKRRVKNKQQN